MCCLLPSFRIVNSPISCTERYGSQNVQAELAHTPIHRRSLTFTKFARSSHAREASVSGQVNAPLAFLYGESEINTLTIPLTQRF